jgi:beta-galactosidase
MNIFRHWFMWSAIELAPGEYDWTEYDRQLDLAAQNKMKTIVAEMITAAPEWAYRVYADARLETTDGRKLGPSMGASSATGGFPGLCLDHAGYHAAAERFLRALVERYKGHPGLGGYDIWNECNYPHNTCCCPASEAAFRDWLRAKYGDLRAVGRAWRRYSFAEWADVTIPRAIGPYPDTLDWLQFRLENAYRHMRWRVDLIRSIDPDCAISAHGIAGSLHNLASGGSDDWRAAAEVESYGLTWGSSRHGDEPWKQFHAFDLVRAASRGKPFWHAEHYGGPLWMQPQVLNKPRKEGRIAAPEDIRYWSMVSFLTGATGVMYLRWRPLLDGPLFGAFGPYGMDGSRTPRSEMVGKIGKWAQSADVGRLWQACPVKGEVGIVFVPETQMFLYGQQGNSQFYQQALQGVYRGFWENNIQADFVHIDDIGDLAGYQLLYLPLPVMLSRKTADRLKEWVSAGGTLVCEGLPGYFGDGGRVDTVQPGQGLDVLFGARESYVEFTPDLLGDLRLTAAKVVLWGGIFMQAYTPTVGAPCGWYEDGQVAAVDNTFGAGKTRLVGSMVGYGFGAHSAETAPGAYAPAESRFFSDILTWAGIEQHVRSSDRRVKARIHSGAGGIYLWVANPTRQPLPVRLELAPRWGPVRKVESLWGGEARGEGQVVEVTVPARDVVVMRI